MRAAAALLAVAAAAEAAYMVGVGKADMTGPIAQVNMMGMANPSQKTSGLHLRLWARAFVVADDAGGRVAFVSVDNGMPSTALRQEVTKRLAKQFPDGRYTARNVMISGTHTHSGPGGYFEYFLDQITCFGFNKQTWEAFNTGIVDAIVKADASLRAGSVSVSTTTLPEGSNINRSPTSYLENPAEERAQYPDGDTDRGMLQLQFLDAGGKAIGAFNWFAIHGTVMNNTNEYVSGDSRGLASQRVEQAMAPRRALPGEEDFVAAFAATNLGDVSPNTGGMVCHTGPAAGQPCNITTSTCPSTGILGQKVESAAGCWMLGPGKDGDMFKSNHIMAQKQVEASLAMLNGTQAPVSGPVSAVHQYVNMSSYAIRDTTRRTCPAGLGYGFAGGTVDGPGDFDFHQHTLKGEPFWDFVSQDILIPLLGPWWGHRKPTAEDYACHSPKPVLLFTGFLHGPWQWQPDVLDLQMIRVGDVVIVGVPGEFTTMAGRRMRAAVKAALVKAGLPDTVHVALAGLSNQYTHYITTREEYGAQRYEAASTLYGPHTLEAYEQIFGDMAAPLAKGAQPPEGQPPKQVPLFKLPQLLFAPKADPLPAGAAFGQLITDVEPSYAAVTEDTFVTVKFYAANPRHDMHLSGSYLYVERRAADGGWEAVANDNSESTRIRWAKVDDAGVEVTPDLSAFGDKGPDGNPSHPLRHLWGPLLWQLGEATGARLDLARAKKCWEEGRAGGLAGDLAHLAKHAAADVAAADLGAPLLERLAARLIAADLRAEGGAARCSLADVMVPHPRRSHPLMQFHDGLEAGLGKATHSEITASWQPAIPGGPVTQPGTYRLRYAAEYKGADKALHPFNATSSTFKIVA